MEFAGVTRDKSTDVIYVVMRRTPLVPGEFQCLVLCYCMLHYVAVCCSVLQCVTMCCNVVQLCCTVMKCVAVCCSVLQCVVDVIYADMRQPPLVSGTLQSVVVC